MNMPEKLFININWPTKWRRFCSAQIRRFRNCLPNWRNGFSPTECRSACSRSCINGSGIHGNAADNFANRQESSDNVPNSVLRQQRARKLTNLCGLKKNVLGTKYYGLEFRFDNSATQSCSAVFSGELRAVISRIIRTQVCEKVGSGPAPAKFNKFLLNYL